MSISIANSMIWTNLKSRYIVVWKIFADL